MNVPSVLITARLPLWVERALDAANEQASKEGLLRVPKGDLLYYLYLYHREFHPQVIDALVQPCADLFRRDGCCDVEGMPRQKANFGLKWLSKAKYGAFLQIIMPLEFVERVEAITRPNYKIYLQPRPWLLAIKLLEAFLRVDKPEDIILRVNRIYRSRAREI